MLVLLGLAVSAGIVGVFLVLRKMTMLANSLSHTILLGIVIAFILSHTNSGNHEPVNLAAMLIASLVMGVTTTYLTEFLTKTVKLQEDASIGIVFTGLFAVGIILITLATRDAHIGTEIVMGNIDSLHLADVKLIIILAVINIVLVALFFKEYTITTFDPGLAKVLGISPLFFNYLLMTQVSATAIGAFRAVGVLMVLAFITGPVLAARLLTHDLKKLIGYAILLGCLTSLIAVAISRHILSVHGIPLSTAGIAVCVIALLYLAVWSIRKYKRTLRTIRTLKTPTHNQLKGNQTKP